MTSLAVGAVLLGASATANAAGPDEVSLRAADAVQKEAGAKSDAEATDRLQHPNYLGNAPNNRVATAEEVRQLMASGRIASEGFDREIERVAITGNVGVVMGKEIVTPSAGSEQAKMFADSKVTRRFTNVFLWEDERWKLLARHANVVAPHKPVD